MKKSIKFGLLAMAVTGIMSDAYAAPTAQIVVNASVTAQTCDVAPAKRSVVIPPVAPEAVADNNIDVKGAIADIYLNVTCTGLATVGGYETLIVTGGMDQSGKYFSQNADSSLGIKLTNESANAPAALPADAPAGSVIKGEAMTLLNQLALINSKVTDATTMSKQAHFVAQLHTLAAKTPAGYTTTIPVDFTFNYQ